MSDARYLDELETRPPEVRERALFSQLRDQLENAKKNSAYFGRLLADVPAHAVPDRAALATLPVTRKSDLMALQKAEPPFGGLTAVRVAQLGRVFASPGPIYDPQGDKKDYWGFARALYAAGFRQGELVHNTFSYHFTPAGFMMDSAAQAIGCPVFPAGIGQTELQVQAIADLRPVCYAGTPSFLPRSVARRSWRRCARCWPIGASRATRATARLISGWWPMRRRRARVWWSMRA
jgi:phenylacetate-CoA ligase